MTAPLPKCAALPTWVSLSLNEPFDEFDLVRAAGKLGVDLLQVEEGLQLPGGFLAYLEEMPYPEKLLDRAVAEEPLSIGPVTLHVSGGTNEVERDTHHLPAEARRAARVMREAARESMLDPAEEVRTTEANAGQKILALTRLIADLAPLIETVVFPCANHIALPSGEFLSRAQGCLEGESYSSGLWSYFKIRPDQGGAHVASTGMWVYGLPEVAAHLPAGEDPLDTAARLAGLQGRMLVEGWWPEDDTRLDLGGEELRLRAMPDALWLEGEEGHEGERDLASRRFELLRTMQVVVGEATHHHAEAERDRPAVEHFLRPSGESVAITAGLSLVTQAGGTAEDENDLIELSVTSAELGPWAEDWLDWAASYVRGHDGSTPVFPFDRLVLPEPTRGIAGVIVWPSGHLRVGPEGARVHLWDITPVLSRELEDFRAAPSAQGEWIEAHFEAGDLDELHQRWRSVLVCS